ncbi:unnamed protein product [Allacma fusca]|uniref:SEC14-like protein 2 n=1 Tax=Allacma fusca TaxID=39272 RepID=A0A8J2J899_9HEXA|nr:unnamed protein product [Allacma fusca]
MLRKHLLWRKANSVERLLSWEAPQVLRKEFPFYISGFDKEGSPVFIAPIGKWDIPKIVELKIKGEYQRYIDQVLETAMMLIKHRSKSNKSPTQFIGIADLEGLTYRQFASKEIIELSIEALKRVEANYPEVLKGGYGINAPKIFTVFYALLKPFFSEYTQSKIRLFGSNSDEWRNFLRSHISPDQLPSQYGGSNTTCKTYDQKDGFENFPTCPDLVPDEEMIPVTVEAGDQHEVEVDVRKAQTILKWTFKSIDYDIGFYVVLKNFGKEPDEELVSVKRADAHLSTQHGSIVCETPGKYCLIFSNSYSRVRQKDFLYSFDLLHPPK